MRTEKIIVSSLQEAVEELKRSYGENAVVLSSRVIKRRKWWFFPFLTTTLLEVTIGIPENEKDFKEELSEKLKVYEELQHLRDTLSKVIKNIQTAEEKDQNQQEHSEEFSLRAQRILSRMVYRGVRKEIAKKLIEEACGFDIELGKLDFKEDVYRSLTDSFEKNISVEGNKIIEQTPKVIVLVGPTGVGKTTTIAKLSYLFKRAGKKVGVITLDSYRVGAVEQLRSFIKIMELPFKIADSPEEFLKGIKEMSNRDVIFVDTAGRSHHDKLKLNELKPFLESCEASIYLTLSANLSEPVMYEVIMQFSIFPIKGLVFSKLDETSYPGNVINVAYRTQLPILCFTTGQTVPDDIVMADYGYITKLMLEEKHEFESAGNSPEA